MDWVHVAVYESIVSWLTKGRSIYDERLRLKTPEPFSMF
jgi:hypothetical protein